jgi:hypothetical protein
MSRGQFCGVQCTGPQEFAGERWRAGELGRSGLLGLLRRKADWGRDSLAGAGSWLRRAAERFHNFSAILASIALLQRYSNLPAP